MNHRDQVRSMAKGQELMTKNIKGELQNIKVMKSLQKFIRLNKVTKERKKERKKERCK